MRDQVKVVWIQKQNSVETNIPIFLLWTKHFKPSPFWPVYNKKHKIQFLWHCSRRLKKILRKNCKENTQIFEIPFKNTTTFIHIGLFLLKEVASYEFLFRCHKQQRTSSTVEEVCCHEQLQRNLGRDRKFGNLRGAVCIADFVHEVHADFLQHMRSKSTKLPSS